MDLHACCTPRTELTNEMQWFLSQEMEVNSQAVKPNQRLWSAVDSRQLAPLA